MDLYTLYHRSLEAWADHVNAVRSDQWDDPTPCTQWSVRDLVNHVAAEDLWTVPLVGGSTIAEVGDRLQGDVLGDHPVAAALGAAADARKSVRVALPAHGTVQLSYGEEQIDEYVWQLTADHVIHGWDLAAATGRSTLIDTGLATAVADWFAQREEVYRAGGLVGDRRRVTGDAQVDLLAKFGRDARWGPNHAALARFNAAFGSGDVDAIMALMTADCVFESTGPAPDGGRHEGAEAVRRVWVELFGSTRGPTFTEEESFVDGDRAVVRWRFEWVNADDSKGHVRGVDVMRLRDGLVSEKLSYVKG